MVRVKRRDAPVDYSLCNQTVTLYHWEAGDIITRKVIEKGAFLDFKKVQDVSKTGSTEVNSFLLVIPGSEVFVAAGDKVFHTKIGETAHGGRRRSCSALLWPLNYPACVGAILNYFSRISLCLSA